MPYADKSKQRQAQAASQRKRYHAPGSTLREYYAEKTRARRGQPTKAEKAAAIASMLARAAQAARYGYTGTLGARL